MHNWLHIMIISLTLRRAVGSYERIFFILYPFTYSTMIDIHFSMWRLFYCLFTSTLRQHMCNLLPLVWHIIPAASCCILTVNGNFTSKPHQVRSMLGRQLRLLTDHRRWQRSSRLGLSVKRSPYYSFSHDKEWMTVLCTVYDYDCTSDISKLQTKLLF